jgi:spore germination cell wall hydrolase CwlJ-like protein
MLAQWVALAAGSGLLPPMAEGATHYHASHVQPHWVSSMEPAARIEDHAFYREK